MTKWISWIYQLVLCCCFASLASYPGKGAQELHPFTMSKLTQDQLVEYRSVFRVFDKDGNGKITKEELKKALISRSATFVLSRFHRLPPLREGQTPSPIWPTCLQIFFTLLFEA